MKRLLSIALALCCSPFIFAQVPSLTQLTQILNSTDRIPAQPTASREENDTIGVCHVLASEGKLEEAIQKLEAAQKSARSPHYDHALATFYQDADNLDQAIAYLQSSIDKSPNFGLSHRALGMLILSSGRSDFEEAASALASAYKNGYQSKRELNYLGQSYLSLESFPEAELCFRKALDLDPTYTQVHSYLAFVLESQGKSKEAASFK